MVGEDIPLILDPGVRDDVYMSMTPLEQAYLLWCYHGLAKCEYTMGYLQGALRWIEEARAVVLNARFKLKRPLRDWETYNPELFEFTRENLKIQSLAADIFFDLGNTGATMQRLWSAKTNIYDLTKHQKMPINVFAIKFPKLIEMIKLRHPDINHLVGLDMKYPDLCVSGTWQKLRIRNAGGPSKRLDFASFIWDGHLYIAGGRTQSSHGPIHRDFFRLNLETRESWVPLPKYPVNIAATGEFLGWHMVLDSTRARAYLFTGRPTLDFFDLKANRWDCMPTRFKPNNPDDQAAGIKDWPYPKNELRYSTQQLVDGKLYVFGGTHGMLGDGCSLFMVLDLGTKQWTRLSGTVFPGQKGDYSCPGHRQSASSWVDKAGEHIFLLFGECDRMASPTSTKRILVTGYAYDDLWCWNIKTGKWFREKMDGNSPCARTEASCVYHPGLGKAIVFGGYNANVPTDFFVDNNVNRLAFSYYADTFIYDTPTSNEDTSTSEECSQHGPASFRWQQVISHGFPSYRSMAQLNVDPATGKIYLYGGKITNEYIYSRRVSHAFGDLWQLQLTPSRAQPEEAKTDGGRQVEPELVRRCFACGSVGSWKKCGGSCAGQAYFCDSDCLKEGWKDHKRIHKCKPNTSTNSSGS
ncbi:hypothetical protein BDZ94DRAFT_1179317 [Collybia nuda]|uniref:MYND-type domain-containing protein n=1 Tax=Collybia nuda TaxID=64659 RepID=A0A9P5XUI4_9AGAR|nr:hypothetical protein BDZ94DRAFT_1179317 [Collybia nuda]